MDPKQFGDAMKELAQMTEQAAAESKSLADEPFRRTSRKPASNGDFTAEQLRGAAPRPWESARRASGERS